MQMTIADRSRDRNNQTHEMFDVPAHCTNSVARKSSSGHWPELRLAPPTSSKFLDSPTPKELLPQTIHEHPRRQRVIGRDQPSRQVESIEFAIAGWLRANQKTPGASVEPVARSHPANCREARREPHVCHWNSRPAAWQRGFVFVQLFLRSG